MFPLSSLDLLISEMSLLKHPFYVAWSKGELTLGDLRVYAKEYFHLVERIPGIVARVADRARIGGEQRAIRKNVREEQEHVILWKRFARSLGIGEAELVAHVPSAKVRDAIRSLEELAERGFEEGIAAVYSLERELPAIAQTKKEGLLRFYGLSSADAHAYFDEHLNEEEHLDVWRSMPVFGDVTEAARTSLVAQNQILDAVCEKQGISMVC